MLDCYFCAQGKIEMAQAAGVCNCCGASVPYLGDTNIANYLPSLDFPNCPICSIPACLNTTRVAEVKVACNDYLCCTCCQTYEEIARCPFCASRYTTNIGHMCPPKQVTPGASAGFSGRMIKGLISLPEPGIEYMNSYPENCSTCQGTGEGLGPWDYENKRFTAGRCGSCGGTGRKVTRIIPR